MATPSAPHNTGGMVVVTHVYPQQDAQGDGLPQSGVAPPALPSSRLQTFLKGEPPILGAIQIMIGIFILLFGIIGIFDPAMSFISSHIFGGAIYLTAGSLTVRAYKRLSTCMVKASLGMNIVSAIMAGQASILLSMHFISPEDFFFCSRLGGDCGYGQASQWGAKVGVVLVLSVLQFIISIVVSAFGCKATCTRESQAVMYITNQIPASLLTAPPSTNEIPASLLTAPPSTNEIPAFPLTAPPSTNEIPASLLTAPPSIGPLDTSELAHPPPYVLVAPAHRGDTESAPTGQFEELPLLK
ncbi:membrane-spanning 4-domains subfamily A member 15-like [Engraulis encrasicolus]|uniref:membrane-spanning 4-domains subfamily A member 15-like n=1 Tax=Engraulis encrasicolus TaxID=184585 RepID=UPI002FD5F915